MTKDDTVPVSVNSDKDAAVSQSSKLLLKTDTKNYKTFEKQQNLSSNGQDPSWKDTDTLPSQLDAFDSSSPQWKAARKESILRVVKKDGSIIDIVDLCRREPKVNFSVKDLFGVRNHRCTPSSANWQPYIYHRLLYTSKFSVQV
eukprot:898392_1